MGALLCSLLSIAIANAGGGAKYMETTLQDDRVFLHGTAASVQQSTRQVAALGVDRLRITASWSAIAPSTRRRQKPGAPFDAGDPATYPQANWEGLDRAIVEANLAGLKTQIDVAFFAPRWATGRRAHQRDRQRWWPNAAEFGLFARAVARRYDGTTYSRKLGTTLPAVRLYTTWNEPNETTFLMPQWARTKGGGFRPMSPHIYRAMHTAAYAAIKQVNPANLVLMGATSSKGSRTPGRGGVPPLRFLRELACVDRRMQPLRVPQCRTFTPLQADGYSQHPYSRFTPPGTSDPDSDDVPIANLDRLSALLDQLAKAGRITSRLPVYVTEYGYETRPPDPYQRYTPAQQALYHGWATYLAWQRPDIPMFAQFLLRDSDPAASGAPQGSRSSYYDFQSGLYYSDGSPKPLAIAFRMPFWAQLTRKDGKAAVLLFGQVRPGTGPKPVSVQRRAAGSATWETIKTYGKACAPSGTEVMTDAQGFLLQAAQYDGPASYRLEWSHGNVVEHSIEISVDADEPTVVPR